ncbi:MAG: purine-nucleoside phosphorylase [Pirellulales bacterium]|nr:purine-nucleoside phosphorylase [Pirellulales bacterium]
MQQLAVQIAAATQFIRSAWPARPTAGIILGTGLGNFTSEMRIEAEIPYETIPHFPRSTAMGHKGQLVCGTVEGVPVVTMEGRFHAYEGYDQSQITLPVRVMRELGISLLIISNASGGLNPHYCPGEIMLIEDHINLMLGQNPLFGVNDDRLGPRFPDMSRPYDPGLIELALEIARRENFVAHRGVYVSLTGPNYETAAEYRLLRLIGGDVVGMSTVPETITAVHAGLRVLALSTVTNVANPNALCQTDGADVVAAASQAGPNLAKIVRGVLKRYSVDTV